MFQMFNIFKRKPEVIPATEPLTNLGGFGLKRGSSYLVKEPKPEKSFTIFASIVKSKCSICEQPEAFACESIGCERCTITCPCKECRSGRPQGLCITTSYPEDIRMQYVLQTTPVFWLSKQDVEYGISPSNLGTLASFIGDFLKKSKNPVVILEGIEYMISANSFDSALKFLHDIREWVIMKRGIFIMPASPLAFETKELALLERCMDTYPTIVYRSSAKAYVTG